DGVDGEERAWVRVFFAGLVPVAVEVDRAFEAMAGEMVRKDIGQAVGCRELGRVVARAEQPHLGRAGCRRGGVHGVVAAGREAYGRAVAGEQSADVLDVAGELFDIARGARAAQ